MYENKYKIEKDLIYPQEVFEIVGIMYDIWNKVGPGHKENFYEKATAELFRQKKEKIQRTAEM